MSQQRALPGDAAGRLHAVRERIRAAAQDAGRDPEGIVLVAVSKTHPAGLVLELARAGQRIFGENRVQEAAAKVPEAAAGWDGSRLEWRLIGHLQRNKVKAALDVFDRVDSIDSFRLLEAVDAEAARRGRRLPVLLEFNCSGEASKGGFLPAELAAVAAAAPDRPSVEVRGLMTVGPLDADPEAARPAFRRLRGLREDLEQRWGRELPELSMGMSADLEIGIAEGATVLRVGTALFGSRG